MAADRFPAGRWHLLLIAGLIAGCGSGDINVLEPEPEPAGASSEIGASADAGETEAGDTAWAPARAASSGSSAAAPAVSTTKLEAFHRSGQTFVTWPEDGTVTGESYYVYRSTSPITSSNLSSAKRIATIAEGSGVFTNEVKSGNPYQTNYVIQDATTSGVTGTQLPSGVGLFVHTTAETGPVTEYYAVTVVRSGVEQSLQSAMTLTTGVSESKALPRPVVVWFNGVKTLYTHWVDYAQWNPAWEGYAYNFWVGVPKGMGSGATAGFPSGSTTQLPLQMHLHAWGESWQRFWYSGDSYGSGSPYDYQTIWVEPDDNRNTWFYGFANNVNRSQSPNSSSVIYNYTEQRLLYILTWLTSSGSPFKVDTNRMYLYGGSMGGTGALSFGLRHPELFAGVYGLIAATDEATSTWGRAGFDALWGTVDQNLPTNEGIGVHDRLNTQQYIQDNQGGNLPFAVTFHGRNDTTIEWSTQGLPWVQLHDPTRAIGPEMWADSDHSSSFDIYPKSYFKNWIFTQYLLRRNEAYLVFTSAPGDDSPTAAIPSCRGSAPYAYGYLGNSMEWASSANAFLGYSAPKDTSTKFETAIRIRTDQCNWPTTGTTTVTLRRAQAFKPAAGQSISWENRTTGGSLIQAGTVKLDSSGRLTIPGVQVSTSGSILALSSSGSSSPDNDGDGVTQAQGDCNDTDATVYPGAPEQCDGTDDDCDGTVDEGASSGTWYRDADGDTWGGTTTTQACSQPSGYVSRGGDCNDGDASVYPGAPEQCDNTDDDCDGSIDEGASATTWYRDVDADTWGGTTTSQSCSQPSGYVSRGGDCNDGDAATYPGATEKADGKDNDCDGSIDEGTSTGTNTITLTSGNGSRDALYRQSYEGNYGAADYMTLYNTTSPDYRAVIWFDLSKTSLPIGAKLVSAQLNLYSLSSSTNATTVVYRLTRSWSEGSGTYGNSMNGATWKTYDGKNLWTTAGGDYDKSTNYGSGANGIVASKVVGTGAVSFDITKVVSQWLAGQQPNNGVMLTLSDSSAWLATKYASKEYSDASRRPTLVIQYSSGIR